MGIEQQELHGDNQSDIQPIVSYALAREYHSRDWLLTILVDGWLSDI